MEDVLKLIDIQIDMLKSKIKIETLKLKTDPNNEFIKGRISAFELSLHIAKEIKKDLLE